MAKLQKDKLAKCRYSSKRIPTPRRGLPKKMKNKKPNPEDQTRIAEPWKKTDRNKRTICLSNLGGNRGSFPWSST